MNGSKNGTATPTVLYDVAGDVSKRHFSEQFSLSLSLSILGGFHL